MTSGDLELGLEVSFLSPGALSGGLSELGPA